MSIEAKVNLWRSKGEIWLQIKSSRGHHATINLQDIPGDTTRKVFMDWAEAEIASHRLDWIRPVAGVLLVAFLSFAIITMDCLTHGGLFKTDWWQWLRQVWM